MALEITPKSFILVEGKIFNSEQTVAENRELIEAGKPIKIITVDNFRTGFTDVLEIELYVNGNYSLGDKENYKVLEDGKERAEKEAEEFRARQEAEKTAEEKANEKRPVEETVEEVTLETNE